MNRIVLKSRVTKDGLLHLSVPPESFGADAEVQVTIEPVTEPPVMTQEEWQRGILELAGTWEGEFVRPEQDFPPERDPMS